MYRIIAKNLPRWTIENLSQRITVQSYASRYFSEENEKNTSNQTKNPEKSNKQVSDEQNANKTKWGGFAQAYDKFSRAKVPKKVAPDNRTFSELLKSSPFIDLGDPKGKVVTGKIIQVVEDDLYIDFGWKFNCVCLRPEQNASDYVRGAIVQIRINELELSSRFLGSDKDLTILEADCSLLGLVSSPASRKTATKS